VRMWPPSAKLPRSAPAVLNGRCRARLDMSRSSLDVALRGLRRLHHQGMRVRRPIKRPQLTLRHRHARFDWSHDHLEWTIRTWRRVHWSDESPTDGRAKVWRQRLACQLTHDCRNGGLRV
jgi:hypothetical protein